MADIKKELNDIKNAVYGKEVRGSIHDGIKKINDESEVSKAKANEAHDVMESIMTEGFDNAALEANFEQKLDDKIANLQPEWTGFKDNVETQLAQTESELFILKFGKADKAELESLRRDKADVEYVNKRIDTLDGLQFKGGFNTVQDLEAAYPNGTSGLYVVGDYWYYWDGNVWKRGKKLETMPWADFMTVDGDDWEVS